MSEHADSLVRGIDWLITVDQTRRVIRDAAIAIKDGKFAAVGKSAQIEQAWAADRIVDGAGTVVTPGFIDNHLHASFQMARGLADEANAHFMGQVDGPLKPKAQARFADILGLAGQNLAVKG